MIINDSKTCYLFLNIAKSAICSYEVYEYLLALATSK